MTSKSIFFVELAYFSVVSLKVLLWPTWSRDRRGVLFLTKIHCQRKTTFLEQLDNTEKKSKMVAPVSNCLKSLHFFMLIDHSFFKKCAMFFRLLRSRFWSFVFASKNESWLSRLPSYFQCLTDTVWRTYRHARFWNCKKIGEKVPEISETPKPLEIFSRKFYTTKILEVGLYTHLGFFSHLGVFSCSKILSSFFQKKYKKKLFVFGFLFFFKLSKILTVPIKSKQDTFDLKHKHERVFKNKKKIKKNFFLYIFSKKKGLKSLRKKNPRWVYNPTQDSEIL